MLRNVRPFGHGAIDVSVAGDTISAIGRDLPLPAGATVADGAGALLLPGLIEGHTHLDKTLWGGPWHRNEVGPSRLDRIENERAWRAAFRP